MIEPSHTPTNAPHEEPVETFIPTLTRRRIDGWTADKQRRFVEVLADTGCVSHAVEAVGMSRMSAYRLRRREPNSMFAYAWDTAIKLAYSQLIDIAMERAIEGTPSTVYYRGEMIDERRTPDNRLLMFLLSQGHNFDRTGRTADELVQLWPVITAAITTIGAPPISESQLQNIIADEKKRAEADAAIEAANAWNAPWDNP